MTKQEIEYFMMEAVKEGRKALPLCLPNPPIGCVIVKDGKIIARGHTNPPGEHHAEAMALAQIPEEENDVILFVTLEPCSFHGRTPSCAKAIVARQVQSVYIGILDPHSKNNGAGLNILKEGKIEFKIGILEQLITKELDPYLLKE